MIEAPHPRATVDLLGQDAAEKALVEAWFSGRMPHGWLFGGPEGVGKATLAYRLARRVLAGFEVESGLFATPPPTSLALDPHHPVFARVVAGAHHDLLCLERELDDKRQKTRANITVDQVRGIAEFLHLTAGEGGWRIVIVDSVDDLNVSAANALLKILEEPPARALLLLISHAPGALLPTIRSRCRRLTLDPLPPTIIDRLLATHHPGLDPATRRALGLLGDGSVGRALALAAVDGPALLSTLVEVVGRPPDLTRVHAVAERLGRAGVDNEAAYQAFVGLIDWWLARVVTTAARGGGIGAGDVEEVVAGEGAAARFLVERVGLDPLAELWEKTRGLFAQGDGLHLERRQLLLTALLAISERTA